jgi:hypothetical protein
MRFAPRNHDQEAKLAAALVVALLPRLKHAFFGLGLYEIRDAARPTDDAIRRTPLARRCEVLAHTAERFNAFEQVTLNAVSS